MGYHEQTIGITRSGPPLFVRSHSYHHHHHRPHREHRCRCSDDCCGVPISEFKSLKAQVQSCQDENAKIAAEKDRLRNLVHELNDKYKQLQDINEWYQVHYDHNGRLKIEKERLESENCELRRSLSAADSQIEAYKRRIRDLKREADASDHEKDSEIRHLKRTVDSLTTKLNACKERCDRADKWHRMHEREIKNKDEVIREQTHTIQRLQRLLQQFRGF